MSTRIRVSALLFAGIIVVTGTRVILKDGAVRMDYAEIYIERIRQLCKQRGITVNKLAVMSGVKQSTLDNIVRGVTRNPRVKTLHKLAIAFNMTLSEFLDFEALNEYAFDEKDDD